MVKIPQNIAFVLSVLQNNGYEAYIVGGCVRDSLLGLTPYDYDITTSCLPEKITELFQRTLPTGLKHGTVTVLNQGTPVEVTTFRSEGEYKDSRHPENVEFISDLKTDLERRDFTVNALCYSEKTGLIDCFGGTGDLENKILRAVGDPKKRFSEDALRILRLFRFASQLNFTPEAETLKAATALQKGLEAISRERIFTELYKAVNGQNPKAILPLIKSGGLGFLNITQAPDFKTLTPIKNPDLRFFAFLKGACTNPVEVLSSLKASNAQIALAAKLSEVLALTPKTKTELKRALGKTDAHTLKMYFTYLNAMDEDCNDIQGLLEEILQNKEPYLISHLAVTGKDLMDKGLKGTEIGVKQRELLEIVIEEPSKNRKNILLELT